MTLREQLRADRERLKTLSPRARAQFVWDYYKLPIIVTAVLLVLAALVLATNLGRADTALYAVFVNTDVTDEPRSPAALEALLEGAGVDMKGRHIDVTDNLYLGQEVNTLYDAETLQVLAALFGISDLDFFAADEATFRRYADQDAFADLSKLIDAQVLAAHADQLWYYENADGQRVLGGLIIPPGSALHQAGYFHGDVVVGAAVNADNLDSAVRLAEALLRQG